MNTTRMLFPGAMGPDGFISCFDDLIDENNLRRRLILKGDIVASYYGLVGIKNITDYLLE